MRLHRLYYMPKDLPFSTFMFVLCPLSLLQFGISRLVQIDRWRYNSVTMRIISGVVPGVSRLAMRDPYPE